MWKFHSFSFRHGVNVGKDKKIVGILASINEILGVFDFSNFWRFSGVVDSIWFLGKCDYLSIGCRWFGTTVVHFFISLSSSDSGLLRYFSMVLLISSNSNSIALIFISISFTPFIDWDYVGSGGDFDLASGLPAANLFYNTFLKS